MSSAEDRGVECWKRTYGIGRDKAERFIKRKVKQRDANIRNIVFWFERV